MLFIALIGIRNASENSNECDEKRVTRKINGWKCILKDEENEEKLHAIFQLHIWWTNFSSFSISISFFRLTLSPSSGLESFEAEWSAGNFNKSFFFCIFITGESGKNEQKLYRKLTKHFKNRCKHISNGFVFGPLVSIVLF